MVFRAKQNRNEGSTLLLVVVVIAFIGILGSVAISMTMTNVQMKLIDAQSKENFYSAEGVMDEIKASIEEIAVTSVEGAYTHVMQNYVAISGNPSTKLKDEFDREFLDRLMISLTTTGTADGLNYDVDEIKLHLRDSYKANLLNENGNLAVYPNQIEKKFDPTNPTAQRYVKIKGIKVKYLNINNDQETILTTDIVIGAPGLEFTTGGGYPEFSKYALIANKQLITSTTNNNFSINGNVYAGAGGVYSTQGTLNMTGSYLITRGDVSARNGASLNIGSPSLLTNIWTENVSTERLSGSSLPANLNIIGNCYVSDDLILKAKNSKVDLQGNYFGYNFNKGNIKITNDTELRSNVNSQYSSSIIINGLNSSLNLSNLNNLHILGRTFISRDLDETVGGTSNDIMMGQSVAVKSNQTAYLVPNTFMVAGHNPIAESELSGGTPISAVDFTGISPALANLLSSRKIATYFYSFNGIRLIYYYWDFKDQQSANKYFLDLYSTVENVQSLDKQGQKYIADTGNGLTINSHIKLLGGTILSVDPISGASSLVGTGITNPDVPDPIILNASIRKAMEYKSRQLELVSSASGVTSTDFRLVDKQSSPLFETIITQDAGNSVIANEARNVNYSNYGFAADKTKKMGLDLDANGVKDCSVVFVDNAAPGDPVFNIDNVPIINSNRTGIVVATGNVLINANFTGLIIAGGKIETYANFVVNSSPVLVQDILRYGIDHYGISSNTNFIHYFTQYKTGTAPSTSSMGKVDIASSITFDNWKKNAD